MTTTHELTLDLQKKGELQRIDVVQGDAGTRLVELTLVSNGYPWEVPVHATPAVRYLKPDGSSGVYDHLPDGGSGFRFNGNVLTMELAPQLLTCAGAVQVQVELSYQEQRIATFAFLIVVEQAVAMDGETGDYVNWTKLHLPQVTDAEQGQFLQVAQVDEDGRVVELAPVDDPAAAVKAQIPVLETHILAVGQRVEDAAVDARDALVLASKAVEKPQTAQVGQLLAVKAVTADGYPTEWETVDLPEGNAGEMCAFYITVTGDDENGYTADKTATEIREAMAKGCILYVKVTVDGLQLILSRMDELLDFSLTILHVTYSVLLELSDTDDSVGVYYDVQQISPDDIGALTPEHVLPLIHNVPTKLPNPKKLTFSGAVSGAYDGSAEVNIVIPGSGEVCDLLMDITTVERVTGASQLINAAAYKQIFFIAENIAGHSNNSADQHRLGVTFTNRSGETAGISGMAVVAQETAKSYCKGYLFLTDKTVFGQAYVNQGDLNGVTQNGTAGGIFAHTWSNNVLTEISFSAGKNSMETGARLRVWGVRA